uniref:Homeobox-DDT domain protein RLT1-like isoform X2 n=1 Tax=Tanacetum cinerariifolium TaxID=118510 RepID=A0A6L2JSC1_TANCI|nr:homeobox-DDT domain protein RLT1-like isoform X2 [Tanacetum cinerariifolium]
MEGIVFALAFEGMKHIHLCVFPPKSVQVRLKCPFLVHPWIDSEEHVGNLFLVWRFCMTFADVLGLWPFTLDEFVQSLHDYGFNLPNKKMYAHINLNMRSARKPTIFIAQNVTIHLLYTIKNRSIKYSLLLMLRRLVVDTSCCSVAMTPSSSIVGDCFDASAPTHYYASNDYSFALHPIFVHLGSASALNSKDQHLYLFGPQRPPSKKGTIPSNIHVVQQPDAIVTTLVDTIRPSRRTICNYLQC